ncbi:transporter substrate-binding domain-containing protein [Aeromicrobium sp. 636]|uniref:Amino acid ABC transporter substrate-binding protein n=1 Tax=Aeromicrobium senzhongii TaxID=2663859 RepID=A0A8I0EUM4_9ACTN|nr:MULTISPECIES: transporter substrate-binding domain-containing protein [Aeromicrobium]MBC9226454.1 amino acid ABC transporter substrate-binding protein [Aeromicrobium senzhongii]MCQ3998558.1 transporter substrate-binding domain-containing protein [Aeromicrobium sp. 636]MTB89010.1 transporter substrate-binding domain-containing protein [Aeromicrobium senzhongii]QNL93714.1 amino acid ABC transporter substrate-binding protein [Aeromicrobium senzhongii]
MKRITRTFGLALGAVVSLSALAACGSDDAASTVADDCEPIAKVETVKDGTLTAAIANFPPYIGAKDGQPTGIDGELLKKVAADLCLELKAQSTSFPGVVSALDTGKADLSAGSWTVNDERRAKYELSDPVYLSLMSVGSKDGWDTIEQLEGKKVGTTTGYLFTGEAQKALGADNVKLYQSEQAVYDDLKAGRIDAGLFTEGALAGYLTADGNPAKIKNEVMQETPKIAMTTGTDATVVMIRKGATDLRDAVNQVLAEYQSSGELAKNLEKAGISEQSAING